MDLFLAHCLGLLWLSVGAARRLVRHPVDQLLAAVLLTWGNLAATRFLLGLVDRLDDPVWIFGISLVLALLLGWPRSGLIPAAAVADGAASEPGAGLWLIFATAVCPLALVVLGRVYLDQPDAPEFMQAAAWSFTGFGLYRLGRVCALGAKTALALTWLGLAAGAAAVSPDLPAPLLPAFAGLLAGLGFTCQWQQGRRRRHALLGLLATVLVAGSLSGKFRPDLHWSGPPPAIPAAGPLAPDNLRLFAQDLVHSPETGPAVTVGLRPAEGPFPLRDLPRFRGVRKPGIRLVIPEQAGLNRLRIHFSLGLLQRDKTEIAVLFNGRTVKQYQLHHRGGWVDGTLELAARPGENVLEFSDAPHQLELDWRGYLERYPDVMRHVVTHNIPPEEGALDHYELSGRPEGRIMQTRMIPPPVPGAYYFLFRQLEVEGLR